MQVTGGAASKLSEIKVVRKNIARVLTVRSPLQSHLVTVALAPSNACFVGFESRNLHPILGLPRSPVGEEVPSGCYSYRLSLEAMSCATLLCAMGVAWADTPCGGRISSS